ncbi:MAG: ATP-binding protein, partial [Opitutales bacterium]
LGLVRDLSEKKASEERLRRSEHDLRRAQKLEAIGGLAGGIAHDFNNLLTPIMGGTEMTLLDLPAGHPARSTLEQVLTASRRARDLVRQILAFSRRMEPHAQVVETGPIIDEILRLLQPQLPPGVRVQHLRRSPPAVLGDPSQLHQVFQNLCANAALALKDRPTGVIEIMEEAFYADEAFAASHAGLRARTYLRVGVRDTGCGMSPAVVERIFEPFFTTRRPGEGTGLGLAVVHGIIRAHDGALTVYSSPGEGSIFHVYLPAVVGAVPAGQVRETRPMGQGEEIVCIDDDAAVLETLRGQLQCLGYRPRVFNSPAAARDYLTGSGSAGVAGVICDYAMPEIDGISLVQGVSARRSGLRWIMASGYLAEEPLQRARAAGLEHFIDKPPALDDLARTVRRMLA